MKAAERERTETARAAAPITLGGIEAGGTKWICAIGDRDGQLLASESIPTRTPSETISAAIAFFRRCGALDAIGVGSFGPIDLHPGSPTFGCITTTPKPGWAHTDIVTPLRTSLEAPVVLDTDVNVAALGEWRWGAAVGLATFCYMTIGTGIGGGIVVDRRPLHALTHPEIGHTRIPHRERDRFEGSCPYHGDCFEGLASGQSLKERWGRPPEELSADAVWELEADYIALGLVNMILTVAPERIIVGGGVMRQPQLLSLVRDRVKPLVAGYLDIEKLSAGGRIEDYVVSPSLGDRSGAIGALELARAAIGSPCREREPEAAFDGARDARPRAE